MDAGMKDAGMKDAGMENGRIKDSRREDAGTGDAAWEAVYGAGPSSAGDALRGSAYRVGAALLTGPPAPNTVTSPFSALCALLLLRAGAESSTAAELDEVLGLPLEGRDAAVGALLAGLGRYDGDPGGGGGGLPARPVLHCAQGVFVDREIPTGVEFLSTLAQHHRAGVHYVDFSDPATKAVLDGWVATHTGGRIASAPAEYDPSTTLSLLNAAYFAAAWADPFDPSGTYPEEFRLTDGTAVEVEMMHHLTTARYGVGPAWQAVDLPYSEGFVLRVVVAEGTAASGSAGPPILPALTEDALLEVSRVMEEAPDVLLRLGLPRWSSDTALDLMPLLQRLGLRETLGGAPDLDAIQPGAVVAAVAQNASITVGEEGTVAAAVTQIEVMATSVPADPEVIVEVDRPFGYVVIHEATGLPLFLGTVTDPR
jgi:serpin B